MSWIGTYCINFFIGQLYGATFELRDVDGEGLEEECLSIPLRRNGIIRHHTKGALMNLTLTKLRYPRFDRSHFLSVRLPKDIQEEIEELGYGKRLRFIGEGYEMTDQFYHYILKQRNKYIRKKQKQQK